VGRRKPRARSGEVTNRIYREPMRADTGLAVIHV
jgi:hypothetical protein